MIGVRVTFVVTLLMIAAAAQAQNATPQAAERQVNVTVIRGPGSAGAPLLLPPGDVDCRFRVDAARRRRGTGHRGALLR